MTGHKTMRCAHLQLLQHQPQVRPLISWPLPKLWHPPAAASTATTPNHTQLLLALLLRLQ